METHEKAGSKSDAQRKKRRVVTAARKEQNRVAQRLYRQRQKSRRAQGQPVLLTKPLDLRPRLAPEDAECHEHGEGAENMPKDGEMSTVVDVFRPEMTLVSEDIATVSAQSAIAEAADAPVPDVLEQFLLASNLCISGQTPSRNAFDLAKQIAGLVSGAGHYAAGYPPCPCPGGTFEACIQPEDHLSRLQGAESASGRMMFGLPGAEPPNSGFDTGELDSSFTALDGAGKIDTPESTPLAAWPSMHLPRTLHGQSESLATPIEADVDTQPPRQPALARSRQSATAAHRGMSLAHARHLPDPWRNSIQFTKVTVLSAFLNIAVSLGFDLGDITGSNCLGPSVQSPFYRAATPRDNPEALLAAARRPCCPPNLQPTLSQILIPHHPFLDLIPFPALRERAVTLAAAFPPIFSIAELKKDVYIHEALVCWAGSRGAQPWDVRSWEAAPWFLRKWKLLVDSGDEELSRTSQWWQSSRAAQPVQSWTS